MADPFDVPIRDESIRLGQFLKLANLVESGAEAKPLIADGLVRVNDEVETRRGRQLVPGDVVSLGEQTAALVAAGSPDGSVDGSFDDGLPW
jgi:ribosome-associated protein